MDNYTRRAKGSLAHNVQQKIKSHVTNLKSREPEKFYLSTINDKTPGTGIGKKPLPIGNEKI